MKKIIILALLFPFVLSTALAYSGNSYPPHDGHMPHNPPLYSNNKSKDYNNCFNKQYELTGGNQPLSQSYCDCTLIANQSVETCERHEREWKQKQEILKQQQYQQERERLMREMQQRCNKPGNCPPPYQPPR